MLCRNCPQGGADLRAEKHLVMKAQTKGSGHSELFFIVLFYFVLVSVCARVRVFVCMWVREFSHNIIKVTADTSCMFTMQMSLKQKFSSYDQIYIDIYALKIFGTPVSEYVLHSVFRKQLKYNLCCTRLILL